MENRMNEREVSIIDLFYFVLKEWRKLLLACILGMVVFIALVFVKGIKDENILGAENNSVVEKDEYETSISALENFIKNNTIALDDYNEYSQESLFINYDPYNKPSMSANFIINMQNISTEEKNLEMKYNSVKSLYLTYFNTLLDWDELSKIIGKETRYVKELVKLKDCVKSDISNTNSINGTKGVNATNIVYNVDNANNKFVLEVSYPDEIISSQMYDIALNCILDIKSKVEESTYKHDLIYEKQKFSYIVDNEFVQVKADFYNKINTTYTLIKDSKTELIKLKKEGNQNANSKFSKKKVLKYGIIGAFLGCFIVAFWYFCIYIFKGLLHTDDEIKSMYGIEHFGTINHKLDDNKNNIIDKVIRKIFKHNVYDDKENEALNRISVFIENIKNKNIAVIGVCDESLAKQYILKLQKICKGKKLDFIGNPIQSPEVSKKLVKYDSILLIEELEKSNMSDINLEYSLCKTLGKKIDGYVVIA